MFLVWRSENEPCLNEVRTSLAGFCDANLEHLKILMRRNGFYRLVFILQKPNRTLLNLIIFWSYLLAGIFKPKLL